jgi:hypothetical protein
MAGQAGPCGESLSLSLCKNTLKDKITIIKMTARIIGKK